MARRIIFVALHLLSLNLLYPNSLITHRLRLRPHVSGFTSNLPIHKYIFESANYSFSVDSKISTLENRFKKLRIQKFPDTCVAFLGWSEWISSDNDVTIVLTLNRILALIYIFFGDARRYFNVKGNTEKYSFISFSSLWSFSEVQENQTRKKPLSLKQKWQAKKKSSSSRNFGRFWEWEFNVVPNWRQ